MAKRTINYGIKVRIRFKSDSPFEGSIVTLRNITEIHYDYIDGKPLEKKPNKQQKEIKKYSKTKIAFESNIHSTGITYNIEYIDEYETKLENKKAKRF